MMWLYGHVGGANWWKRWIILLSRFRLGMDGLGVLRNFACIPSSSKALRLAAALFLLLLV